jgi:hypothetical protein
MQYILKLNNIENFHNKKLLTFLISFFFLFRLWYEFNSEILFRNFVFHLQNWHIICHMIKYIFWLYIFCSTHFVSLCLVICGILLKFLIEQFLNRIWGVINPLCFTSSSLIFGKLFLNQDPRILSSVAKNTCRFTSKLTNGYD